MANEIDLTKYSPGNIHGPSFAGQPVDALKHVLLSRAGVEIGHSLRDDLSADQTHRSYPLRADNGRLPVPFDPQATPENPLATVSDWFRYLSDPANLWTHEQYTAHVEAEAATKRQNLGTRVVTNQVFGAPIVTPDANSAAPDTASGIPATGDAQAATTPASE